MSQVNSGYERIARDAYMTPRWVTDVLIDDLERQGMLPVTKRVQDPTMFSEKFQINTRDPLMIWECAAGTGQMAGALIDRGYDVFCTDIHDCAGDTPSSSRPPALRRNHYHDFTKRELPLLMPGEIGAIITNPPYNQAETFVANALDLTAPKGGLVAMLLKVDWDSAKTRRKFFADCPAWSRKIVLVDRIHWFDPTRSTEGKKSAGPSENHAWFVWSLDQRFSGQGARIAYAHCPPAERERLKAAARKCSAPGVKEMVLT